MPAVAIMPKRFSPRNLRRYRTKLGLNEAELGVRARCSDEQVKNLERPRTDRTKGPHADLLSALADALGVPMEALFEDA